MTGRVKVYSEVLGREVEVPEEPERIVSLSPAITETLYMLGLEDRIAGVSFFCNKPPRAREKPRVGSYYNVRWDKLEELEPDLVLVTTGAQRKVALELAERGYTVYPLPLPVTVDGILDMVKAVGIVTGRLEAARRLAGQARRRLEALEGSLRGVRAYYEIFLGGPVSAGSHTYIVDLLDHLGLETVFHHDRVSWVINPDPERIRAFDPDIILYEIPPYTEFREEKILSSFQERGLGDLRALREGRLIVLEPDTLAHYGPSIVDEAAKIVARARRVLG